MRILVAPDKFKGCLTAAEAAHHIAEGICQVAPGAKVLTMPVADGGEGTAETICKAVGGEWHVCQVRDAVARLVRARYCTIGGGATAVMEASEACGLWRLSADERDPVNATTAGVGEMLLDAAKRGVSEIIIGLGGSATNDGGFGLARALGYRFCDAGGRELGAAVTDLLRLDNICPPAELRLPRIIGAADVRNPLLGESGATRVFAAQKGATAEQRKMLEQALTRLADVVARDLNLDLRDRPRAGAAGGLGFGLMSFCAAEMRGGFDVVAEHIRLEEAVRDADIIVTGEGRLDSQTVAGKAPAGVAKLARQHGKRVCAIVGSAEASVVESNLFDRVFVLASSAAEVSDAMSKGAELLRQRAGEFARWYR